MVYKMTWEEVDSRIEEMVEELEKNWSTSPIYIYGIPRGGLWVALLLRERLRVRGLPAELVDYVDLDVVVVDDVVDSGSTINKYLGSARKILVLVNKQEEDLGWIQFPWEVEVDQNPEENVRRLLQWLGEDVNRDGLKDTPRRVCKAWQEMLAGNKEDPAQYFSAVFDVGATYDQLVVVKGIRFTSMCEHHIMPFVGEVDVGYLPSDKVYGVSKVVRLVQCYARRLQIQERMTSQIADAFMDYGKVKAVGVVVRAKHSCMGCRGVKQPDAEVVTSAIRGDMLTDNSLRQEFLRLIYG